MPVVKVDDLQIHYVSEGRDSPLILLHGLGNNSKSWRRQVEGLKDYFTVIAWDAPGYGGSSDPLEEFRHFRQFADVLKGFVDQLGLTSIHLLGHSMGAVIAVEFTHAYPDRVKKLILADATRGKAALSVEENERRLQGRLDSIANLTPQELARQRVPGLLSPNAPEELRREAEEVYSQVRPAGYRSVAYSLSRADPMPLLPHIQVPTLIICGELDRITPVRESQVYKDHIAGAQMVVIPNTGHLCYQEDAAAFNQHVIDFLR